MQRFGWAAIAVIALTCGPSDQAGAGSKKWWKRGCSGCSAPMMVGCHAPLSSCAGPYGYGCSGCSAPTCGSPYGYQATYMMPSCYAPTCGQPAFYAPTCGGGCSGELYTCASSYGGPQYAPYVYMPNPYANQYGQYGYAGVQTGCAGGCAGLQYAPYVYQPNPYVNTYGVGAPVGYRAAQGHGGNTYPAAYPLMSAYNAPVAPSIPTIPPLPPAEDVAW